MKFVLMYDSHVFFSVNPTYGVVNIPSTSTTIVHALYIMFLLCMHVVPQKMGPPILTKAVRSGRPALTVTWTAPRSDRPVTKYQVQYRRTGTTSWSTRDVRTRSVTLENLSPGTSYQVQVRAVSDVGSGSFSDMRTLLTYRGLLDIIPYTFTVTNPGYSDPTLCTIFHLKHFLILLQYTGLPR